MHGNRVQSLFSQKTGSKKGAERETEKEAMTQGREDIWRRKGCALNSKQLFDMALGEELLWLWGKS